MVSRLIPHVLRDKHRVVLALALLALAKAAALTGPWILKLLVDGLAAAPENLLLPVGLIGAYAGLRLASGWLGEWRDLVFGRVTERTMRNVGVQVFAHLQSLDLAFHRSRQTGSLSRDIERGITGIRFLLRFLLFNILPTLLELIVVGAILIIGFGWSYGALMLVSVVVYVLWSVQVTEWRTRHVRDSHARDSAAHGRAVDALLNFETVKYFGAETRETQRYDAELAHWETAMRGSRRSLAVLNGGQILIIGLALLGMLLLAGRGVVAGDHTVGDFVMINAYLVALFTPLNFLGFVYREIKASLVALQRLFTLLDAQPTVRTAPSARAPSGAVPPEIRFEQVQFHFDPRRPIINELSFVVAPGTTTAIVGPSGAGKSTLARLLFRFDDPQDGRILWNGVDLRKLDLDALRAAIGVVPQDAVLFNDSIVNNIAYGRPDASTEDVRQAIAAAALEPLIASAPDGLDTPVGERGMKVSGGERQRMALARVLLKNPPVLILDEATSSLDSRAEAVVLSALDGAMQQRTCIAIAHRLSTIRHAEQILVLDAGRIVERGTHAALLSQGGLYAELWWQQSREDLAVPPEPV
ncbi:MAG: ABC transporter ATP-binding protein/permease [Oceanococcaceae bacterium]